jgi:membrane associated rhomboid family serine protease
MKIVWVISNAVAVVTALVCMSYLYYECRPVQRRRLPVSSIMVIGATVIVTGVQFIYPDLLMALRRDPGAIRSGELWRLVTALFVQPNGISQCLANGFLTLAFMPAAERIYGKNVLVVYFASGITGQIVNHFWKSGSGGSSTAIFGLIGSLLIYIILNRNHLRLPFAFIAGAGLFSSIGMLMSRDGHGVGLIVGALIASILPLDGLALRSSNTGISPAPNSGIL